MTLAEGAARAADPLEDELGQDQPDEERYDAGEDTADIGLEVRVRFGG